MTIPIKVAQRDNRYSPNNLLRLDPQATSFADPFWAVDGERAFDIGYSQ